MSHDSDLQQTVLAELSWEPSVTAANIGVTAKAGVVALTGHVESYVEKYAAETAARRVRGVKAVAEEIEVRLPSALVRDDVDIAEAALDRLAWDVSVPTDTVRIKVENGLVTLTGEVDWHYQKVAAEHDIGALCGVVDVCNLMTIKPRVNVSDLSNDIILALHRSRFDPKTIRVRAEGGKVHLTGTVRSWHDWNEAESTAWAAPGVYDVQNDIAVLF
jgi:osmotically-inducible protein OsmY